MDIREKIDEYIDFLRKGIKYRSLEIGYEITTPFLNPSNDHLQIYIQELHDDEIILSDGGDTLSYLSEVADLNNSRKTVIQNTVRSYGVIVTSSEELTIRANPKNFAKMEHSLIQAMLKVYDLNFSSNKRANVFVGEVAKFFTRNEIPFSTNIIKVGKTGCNQKYDFLLNAYKKFPERYCDAISPSLPSAFNAIFSWTDIVEERAPSSRFYVFINDTEKCGTDILNAFNQYEIDTILKSEMETSKTKSKFIA